MWIFSAAILLLLAVAGVISYPLLFHRMEDYVQPDEPDESYSERDALLDAISDLEDSFRAGKLSEQDYTAHRRRLELQYVEAVDADGRSA